MSTKQSKLNTQGVAFQYVIGIFIIIGMSIFLFLEYKSYQRNQPVSSFSVRGEARRKITSSKATLGFSIEEQGNILEEANTVVDQRSIEIKDLLQSFGIPDKDIQINKNSYRDYTYEDSSSPQEEIQIVRVEFSVEVEDTQTTDIDQVFSELVSLGVIDIRPVQFEVDNREAVCSELATEAIVNARNSIDLRLKALGGEKVIKTSLEEERSCNTSYNYPFYYDSGISQEQDVDPTSGILQDSQELQADVVLLVEYR